MWWKENKITIYTVIIGSAVFLAVLLPLIIAKVGEVKNFKTMPEQIVWAEVVDKEMQVTMMFQERDYHERFVTFKTLEEERIKLLLDGKNCEVFDNLQEGETGILTFKGPINSERIFDRLFISFEKEQPQQTP